jgi:predicted ATPase
MVNAHRRAYGDGGLGLVIVILLILSPSPRSTAVVHEPEVKLGDICAAPSSMFDQHLTATGHHAALLKSRHAGQLLPPACKAYQMPRL